MLFRLTRRTVTVTVLLCQAWTLCLGWTWTRRPLWRLSC